MNIVYFLYNEVLYRPLFNGLILIYSFLPIHDIGISIVILTFFVRLVLFPATIKAFKSQAALRVIQPKLKAIQEEFKGNKEEQTKRIMALYAEHKMNPFSGCLPILIQLPILIALYRVFWVGLKSGEFGVLYYFVAAPAALNLIAFGFIDIAKSSIPLAILAGVSQFFQARFIPQLSVPTPQSGSSKEPDLSKILMFQTKYFLPILIAVWSFSLPSALPLYWTTMSLLAIVEQILIKKRFQQGR
ncbi:MAG: YidC/Oxa1 family membrane protein insertase [bacterium]|nr:YidC/Oxa1 family membrane protein insertase [bacterium]